MATLIAVCFGLSAVFDASRAQNSPSRVDDALQNVTMLVRAGRVGYATIWDGNKYVQCRRLQNRDFRCEAAGASLQPSLQKVLTPERLTRLASLGWVLDPSFGNYVQTFPADIPTKIVADRVSQTLIEAYGADGREWEIQTAWVADIPCPPRNGPSQNLAGSVNDSAAMRPKALLTCSYTPNSQTTQTAGSAAELIAIYGAMSAGEIQRLRINAGRKIYAIFDAGIGYVQCAPEGSTNAIYCEAQSSESWPALATVLTPERVSYLRNAGYSDPGRAPNYSKSYPFEKFSDSAIAHEILTILHEVYGYRGAMKLKVSTE